MIIGINDVLAILPELIVVASACVLLLFDFYVPKENKSLLGWLSIAVVAAAAAGSCYLARGELVNTVAFSGMFTLDNYSFFFKGVFFIATALSIMLSFNYIRAEGVDIGEYYILMLFSLVGMMVMASGSDLLSIYLGLELMSLPVYVLVGFLHRDKKSNEGAMKYIILGAFSSGILLFGISLIYGITGTTQLTAMAGALGDPSTHVPALSIAIVMLVAGFGFKIAGVPFHMWAPDAYEGAPTPVTAFMSVGPKAAAFAVILRVFLDGLYPVYEQWHLIIAAMAIATMAVGNIAAIAQSNLKRMLAYSSIGHAGYALLGVVAGGEEGTASVMFYSLVYAFMNIGAFGVIILMRGEGVPGSRKGELLTDYKGLAKENATLAFLMLLFMFSLAGIPPTAGFIGKFYIFMALIHKGYIGLAVAGVLLSAVAAYYYIRVVMLMYMQEPEGGFEFLTSRTVLCVLLISAAAVLLLGVLPGYFIALAEKASILL